MFHNSVCTNLLAIVIPIYHHFWWGGFIFQRRFVHSLSCSVAVCPSVSQGNNFCNGNFTTRKPWVLANWCLSIAIFLRASPNKSISRCSSSLPIQGVFTALFNRDLTQQDGSRERTAKVDRVTRVTTWFVSNLMHFQFATAVLLTFTMWKQAVLGCEENVSIFILLSLSKLLYKNFPFAAQTCQELGTRLSPDLGHRIWPTRSFRCYDQKQFQDMNFATLLLNSVANSQIVSAVWGMILRYSLIF